ncbi:hypothetical protein [Phormidium sp. FACHB-1136]|uniref:hypothetical protein n=1 Tax=Phormidium sp. FACHB-1136 TaxID=2692848 RepID=UPI0016885F60|nr:hypothetical protein [Phormidium sp. FACHB-1136]MBD2428516.1 hypothetical protein [Phormidium sp. FACHB-1136]
MKKNNLSEIKKMYPKSISDVELQRIADAILYVRDNMIDNCPPHQTCFYVSYMGCRLINRKDFGISLTNLKLRTGVKSTDGTPCIELNAKCNPEHWHCAIFRAENNNTSPSEIIDFNIGAICRAYIEQGGVWDRESLPEWIRLKTSEQNKYGIWYTTFPLALVNIRQQEIQSCIPMAEELAKRAANILKTYRD